jgi:hypothetical protein
MSSKVYVARSRSVAARRLGDEIMIMSGHNSTLFTLDEVAAIIWEAADGSRALEEIVDGQICPQFEVGRDEALLDAKALAEGLAKHGILLVSSGPMTATNGLQPAEQ